MNLALLAKWAWKFYDTKEGLWASFARNLYQQTHIPIVISPDSASPLMKDIHTVMIIFNNFIRFGGNFRDNIMFWKHNWMGERLQIKFPNLHSFLDNREAITVNEALHLQDWTGIFNLPLSTVATRELDELIILWEEWVESEEEGNDAVVTWSLTNDGAFTTASIYTIMAAHPKCNVTYNYIWKLRVPPKIRIFIWRLLRNILPTLDQLAKRGFILPNVCLLCMAGAESVLHLFQDCTFAAEIFSALGLQITQTIQTLNNNGNLNLRIQMAAICFGIWKERCARTFRNDISPPRKISEYVQADINLWSNTL